MRRAAVPPRLDVGNERIEIVGRDVARTIAEFVAVLCPKQSHPSGPTTGPFV